jgi:tetratricopeptide (TPR) repeat protein
MKRIFYTLAGAIAIALPAAAQTQDETATDNKANANLTLPVQTAPMATPADFVKDPAWQEAFMYSFTPLSDVEPAIDATTRDFIANTLQPLVTANNYEGARKVLLGSIAETGVKTTSAILYCTLGAVDQQLAGGISMTNASAAEKAQQKMYLDEAIVNYNKAITAFPNYQRVYRNLGNIYMNSDTKGDQTKAIPFLQKAIALGARDSSTYLMLGYCQFTQGNYYSAESAFKMAIMLESTNKDVYQLLAQTMLLQNRYKEARAMFLELLAKDPNNAQWWMALVNTYLAENDLDNCVSSLEVLRHMKKAETQSLFLLGNIYVTHSMYDIATDVYVQAVKEDKGKDPSNAMDAARSLAAYAAFDQANRVIDIVENKYQGDLTEDQTMDVLTMRSNIQIAQGQGAEAAKTLQKILERQPLNGNALTTLANYYCELVETIQNGESVRKPRDFQRAVMLLNRAEDLNDDQAKLRAYTMHARLLVSRQDTDSLRDAVALLERAQGIQSQESVASYIQSIRQALDSRSAR